MLSPMCMRSLTTIGYEIKKPLEIANLITTTLTPRTTTRTRTTLVAPFPGPIIGTALCIIMKSGDGENAKRLTMICYSGSANAIVH